MENQFKKGDVVELKSGGPKMTIEKYKILHSMTGPSHVSKNTVVCTWFDSNGVLQSRDFEHDALKIIENDK